MTPTDQTGGGPGVGGDPGAGGNLGSGGWTANGGSGGGSTGGFSTGGFAQPLTGGTSSGGDTSQTGGNSSGGVGGETNQTGGSSSGGVGGETNQTGGSSSGGVGESGGAASGGSADQTGGASGDGGSPPVGPFTCNLVMGLTVTSEWYLAGFEQQVDDSRWQLKWQSSSYVDLWGDPNSSPWSASIVSPCAAGSASPDRVVFTVLSWNVMPQAQWESQINTAISTIQGKYPNVKRFDLLTIVRGPNNQECPPLGAAETVVVPPELDAAIAAVAANSAGLVFQGPKFEGPDCAMTFDGAGPHLIQPGVATVGQTIGEYFAELQ